MRWPAYVVLFCFASNFTLFLIFDTGWVATVIAGVAAVIVLVLHRRYPPGR